VAVSRPKGVRGRIIGLVMRRTALGRYGSILHSLIVMVVIMGMPIGPRVAYGFAIRDDLATGRTFVLANDGEAVGRALHRQGIRDCRYGLVNGNV